MKTVLVPVDFSRHSENAFKFAAKIASIKGMRIKLIHILEDAHERFHLETKKQYFDQLSKIAEEHLVDLCMRENQQSLLVEYAVEVAKKGIAHTIAAHEDADLIVMGKVGVNHEDNFPLGSTASRVIRSAPVPVITVGQLSADVKIQKIVFASDFKEEEVVSVVDRVIRLAEILMAELYLVKIETKKDAISSFDEDAFQLSLSKFNLRGLKVTLHVDRTEEEGILNFANAKNADLIAICTHGRNALVNIIRGSIGEHVSIMADIPVLTYNLRPDSLDRTVQPITRERQPMPASKKNRKDTIG